MQNDILYEKTERLSTYLFAFTSEFVFKKVHDIEVFDITDNKTKCQTHVYNVTRFYK